MKTNLQLTLGENNVLESIYGRQIDGLSGYNPRKLESVEDLTAYEKKFFTDKNFVSPHFFVQTLYKVRGSVSPIKFNLAVNQMLRENKNLRANFCNLGTRTVKVVRPASLVKPEILFRNLTQKNKDELDSDFIKIFEADMRRDVDFRHDALIRFAVYRTSKEDFAVLVTMPQIVSESFNADKFFADVTDTPAEIKPQKIAAELSPKNQEAIREYWAKILDKAPPTAILPFEKKASGAYNQRAFRTTIPADIFSDLREHAQSNRLMLTAILQSAWGFMLQFTNKRSDCLFCQILSSNISKENFSLNGIPVRLTSEDNLTIEQIIRNLFRQLVVSQPYSRIDWDTLSKLTDNKKLFNHFLSFKEFHSEMINYVETPATPQGEIVYQNSWDAQGMELGAYFSCSEKDLSISFLYDAQKFLGNGMERLCEFYKLILRQMLIDWHEKYSEFMKRLRNRAEVQIQAEEVSEEDKRKKLRDFISQLPILQGRFGGTIGLFERHATLVTLYEGDRISGDMLKEKFIFIADGILSRNVDTGDGWFNTLDIIEKNAFVNPTNLLEEQLFALSATVLTEQADLLTISHDVFVEILHKSPDIALSVLNGVLKQMERYQFLWVQS